MSRPPRSILLGILAGAMLSALGFAGWAQLAPRQAQTGQRTLPTPPQRPRLADSPEFDRCMSLLRRDPVAARAFAESWDQAGGGDGARHCLALSFLALGDAPRAAERLEALASRSDASRVARAVVFGQAAQAWMMAGQAGRAYAATTQALTLQPDDVDLLIDRAVSLASLGRYGEAMLDLDRAVLLEPDRAEALVFRAAALRHLDRLEQAARDIERALAIEPENAEALLERGIIRQLRGDAAGAREDWERAIAVAPNSAAADLAAQNLALNEAGPRRR